MREAKGDATRHYAETVPICFSKLIVIVAERVALQRLEQASVREACDSPLQALVRRVFGFVSLV